jgi:L-ascorbate metabolism protein UlaG (beta-lactamase superfamily)
MIVIDPGEVTPDAAAVVARAAAVLVTHEHFDHFDPEVLTTALRARPELRVYAPGPVVERLGPATMDGRVVAVSAGDRFDVAGFSVTVYGREHAVIHREIPVIANVGYLIDESVFHPGDAYLVPGVPVETLLVPTSGPWTKTGEAIDFVRAVRPGRSIQIHELLLSEFGQRLMQERFLSEAMTGVPLGIVAAGESITV